MPERTWTDFAPTPPPIAEGKEWHVFLSYRSVNRPWVLNLYDELRARGNRVFLDQVALVGGKKLLRQLQENLEVSQAGVLIWSRATADSEWVEDEYTSMDTLAKEDKSFQFVPVRLDDSKLPLFARNRVFFDFSSYPDGPNGGELLRLLHAIQGEPLSDAAARFASEQDTVARRAAAEVKTAIDHGRADKLVELFERGGISWTTTPVLGCMAGEGLTRLKEYDGAIALLENVEKTFPVAIRPQQLRALAHARRAEDGDLDEAQHVLGTLYHEGHRDPETLGIYARTWMDRFAETGDVLDLRKSRDLYVEAFDGARDDYYTGINAAAKSVMLGTPDDVAAGAKYARRVEEVVGTARVAGDYWKTATVAEVQLLQGNHETAATRYRDAVDIAPKERGSHETSWKQACRLLRALDASQDDIAKIQAAFAHLDDYATVIARDAG